MVVPPPPPGVRFEGATGSKTKKPLFKGLLRRNPTAGAQAVGGGTVRLCSSLRSDSVDSLDEDKMAGAWKKRSSSTFFLPSNHLVDSTQSASEGALFSEDSSTDLRQGGGVPPRNSSAPAEVAYLDVAVTRSSSNFVLDVNEHQTAFDVRGVTIDDKEGVPQIVESDFDGVLSGGVLESGTVTYTSGTLYEQIIIGSAARPKSCTTSESSRPRTTFAPDSPPAGNDSGNQRTQESSRSASVGEPESSSPRHARKRTFSFLKLSQGKKHKKSVSISGDCKDTISPDDGDLKHLSTSCPPTPCLSRDCIQTVSAPSTPKNRRKSPDSNNLATYANSHLFKKSPQTRPSAPPVERTVTLPQAGFDNAIEDIYAAYDVLPCQEDAAFVRAPTPPTRAEPLGVDEEYTDMTTARETLNRGDAASASLGSLPLHADVQASSLAEDEYAVMDHADTPNTGSAAPVSVEVQVDGDEVYADMGSADVSAARAVSSESVHRLASSSQAAAMPGGDDVYDCLDSATLQLSAASSVADGSSESDCNCLQWTPSAIDASVTAGWLDSGGAGSAGSTSSCGSSGVGLSNHDSCHSVLDDDDDVYCTMAEARSWPSH